MGRRPRRRYRYVYTLFSTSGFSASAQEYAIAHQISLVDLSGERFAWLRSAVSHAADEVFELQQSLKTHDPKALIQQAKLREVVRRQLETGAPAEASITVPSWWSSGIEHSLTVIASSMRTGLGTTDGQELFLGFPPAPFVLTLAAQSPYTMQHFLTFVRHRHRQRHAVGPRRQRVDAHVTQWEVFARKHPDAYRLSFTVPDRVEEWIGQSESTRKRTLAIKESLLATIVLYRLRLGHVTVYQPEELSTPSRPTAT